VPCANLSIWRCLRLSCDGGRSVAGARLSLTSTDFAHSMRTVSDIDGSDSASCSGTVLFVSLCQSHAMSLLTPAPEGSLTIAGIPARIACLRFANRVFLTVSQLPSFGALVRLHAC